MTTALVSRSILRLSRNLNGRGFYASSSIDNGRTFGAVLGRGAMPRSYWRFYANLYGYVLREVRYGRSA